MWLIAKGLWLIAKPLAYVRNPCGSYVRSRTLVSHSRPIVACGGWVAAGGSPVFEDTRGRGGRGRPDSLTAVVMSYVQISDDLSNGISQRSPFFPYQWIASAVDDFNRNAYSAERLRTYWTDIYTLPSLERQLAQRVRNTYVLTG